MNDYKSGIIGRAHAKFGGAIQISILGGVRGDKGKVAILLSEIKEQVGVGKELPDGVEKYGPQVWMEFDNLTSIDMMRDALDCLEEYLKTGSFPKANGKYPRENFRQQGGLNDG